MKCFYCSCHSAGILLSPPAEAQQWDEFAKDDGTEQKGGEWECVTCKHTQGKTGDQRETGFKVHSWEQTWEQSRGWSSHCVPSHRPSHRSHRWMSHIHSCDHIYVSLTVTDESLWHYKWMPAVCDEGHILLDVKSNFTNIAASHNTRFVMKLNLQTGSRHSLQGKSRETVDLDKIGNNLS